MIPIRTSIRPIRTPYTNYALIVINILFFLVTYQPHYSIAAGVRAIDPLRHWAGQFMLTPVQPNLWQFVSYAFLHGGFMHIFGNMFFLYIFGNNVNDKLGHFGYLCFYLAGAVFSAIGHTLVSGSPVLGASGAVAAVTGAYLVLFPQALITVVYWFIFIGTMELPALYFIVLKLIFIDNMIARYTPNVAYDAHLAGYAFGISAILLMLATGLISSSGFDLWSMMKQWNRRRRYYDAVSNGYDPLEGRSVRQIKVREIKKSAAEQQRDEKTRKLRGKIAGWISNRNLSAAAGVYLELMEFDGSQILPPQHLLDIANQLASENKSAQSARAYEQFLANYGSYEYIGQVELMLGILYSRYLNQPDSAVKHLQAAVERLTDPGQLKMCREELAKLRG